MTIQASPVMHVRAWDPAGPSANIEFARVIELHRAGKSTLGHLPFAAFEEAGKRRRLVLGFIDGEVQGYIFYSTPRHHTLKLVHVCVSAELRNSGLAKSMVEFAIAENPERSMITAHCRSDYGIDGFWRALDMTPSAERPGRANAGSTLIIWTRRIGQRDLLEEALYASSRPLAVLDSNVLIDLYVSDVVDRHDRQESLGLTEDWVLDLLELSYSPEVHVDVNAFQPADERKGIQGSLSGMVPVRRDARMKALADAIAARMPQLLMAKDGSLANDAKHLADAIFAGADYFVTRDENLILATREWMQTEHHIEVVRPVELLQRLIPPPALTQFRSDLLESVGLTWTRLTASDPEIEEAFLNHRINEKGSFFRKQLQAVLARPSTAQLEVLSDERGRRWALLGTWITGGVLVVSVLRVGRGLLGSTIAFQLVRHLRSLALAQGTDSVRVTESAFDDVLRAALEADGFAGDPFEVAISEHPDPKRVSSLTTKKEVAAYERQNWPQVVLDRDVPVWVIPIQPKYARSLIGYNDTLLAAREKPVLGLSREFVYFAKPKVKTWALPARAFWYVSKDSKAREASAIRGVVAHSRIVEFAIMSVDEAIEQYRSLGILRGAQIEAQAEKGKVLVLRFEDTQILPAPVGRKIFNSLLAKHGVTTSLITMRSAKPGLFDEILRMQPGFEAR